MRERSRFTLRSAFTAAAVVALSLGGATSAYSEEDADSGDDPVCIDGSDPEADDASAGDSATTDASTTDPDCPDDDGTGTDDGDCAVSTEPGDAESDDSATTDASTTDPDCPDDDGTGTDDGDCSVSVEPGDDGSAPPEELTEECAQVDDPVTGECSDIGGGAGEPGDGGSAGEPGDGGSAGEPGDGDSEPGDDGSEPGDDDTTTDDTTTDDTTTDDTTTDDDTTDDDTTDDTDDPGQTICPMAMGTDGNGAVDCSPDPSACYEAAAGDAAPLATDAAGDGSAATAGETLPVTGGVAGALALLGALCIALGAALLEGQRRFVARGRLTPLRRRL